MHPITAIHPAPPIIFSFVVVGLFVTLIFIFFPFYFLYSYYFLLFKFHFWDIPALISTSFISRKQH
nr:MAG TPA: hypothetical protein [Caudoviricetes sp.]